MDIRQLSPDTSNLRRLTAVLEGARESLAVNFTFNLLPEPSLLAARYPVLITSALHDNGGLMT